MPECPASIDGQGEEGSVPGQGIGRADGQGIGRMKCQVVRSMGPWHGQEEIEVSHYQVPAASLQQPRLLVVTTSLTTSLRGDQAWIKVINAAENCNGTSLPYRWPGLHPSWC